MTNTQVVVWDDVTLSDSKQRVNHTYVQLVIATVIDFFVTVSTQRDFLKQMLQNSKRNLKKCLTTSVDNNSECYFIQLCNSN